MMLMKEMLLFLNTLGYRNFYHPNAKAQNSVYNYNLKEPNG